MFAEIHDAPSSAAFSQLLKPASVGRARASDISKEKGISQVGSGARLTRGTPVRVVRMARGVDSNRLAVPLNGVIIVFRFEELVPLPVVVWIAGQKWNSKFFNITVDPLNAHI